MTKGEHTVSVVREWVEKAENDLKNAAYTLKMGVDCPTDTVCFHAQQCVEKYLKAWLVFKAIEFPRTHDIGELIALSADFVAFEISIAEQRQLTNYATITRYPGNYEPILLAEARKAVAMAQRIRREIRKLLPKETLRKKK